MSYAAAVPKRPRLDSGMPSVSESVSNSGQVWTVYGRSRSIEAPGSYHIASYIFALWLSRSPDVASEDQGGACLVGEVRLYVAKLAAIEPEPEPVHATGGR